MSETIHEAVHFPRERFMYFLGLWDLEWRRQEQARWADPYFAQIEKDLARLDGIVEAYQ